jgi:urease accessory protein UreE
MDNFNYQAYLKNNPLLQEEVKEEKLLTESQEIDETVEETVKEVTEETTEEIQEEVPSSKIKVSELKAKIKETILAELSLSEAEEEVDVDIDVEDEVEVEAGADDIEIERPGVKTTVDVGLSPEEEVVQDSLKAAMDAANELGNQKLADQIGNTITFFTREFVVGQNTD